MVRRARWLTVGFPAIVLAACGGDDPDGFTLKPAETEPIRPSAIEVTSVEGSLTEVVSVGVLNGFGPNGRALVDLLPPPATFGEFALAGVVVDDPNGTGRIDGRWYPPRIKRSNCATSIDSAPVPTVAATYVPGRPTEVYSGESIGVTQDLFGADELVGITIQLFDEASQRDEMFDVLDERYRTGFQVNCDLGGPQDLADVNPLAALAGHDDSSVFEVEQIGFAGILAIVPIDDRVLLQISVGEGIGGGGGATPERSDLDAVAAAQLARLDAATLP